MNNSIIRNETQETKYFYFDVTGGDRAETVYGGQLSTAQLAEINLPEKANGYIMLIR